MGKYAGTLYIPPEKCDIIQNVLDNKDLVCLHSQDLTFSLELKYYGDDIYDIQSIDEKIVVTANITKLVSGKYRLQIVGYICNLKTMNEKFLCIKRFTAIYGEHYFVINNKEAVLRVYRR